MTRWASTFRSLGVYNYRLWTAGSLVSNIGTWMQRIAQDWLVLTELTHHSAAQVGIVTGLQFAPQLLFLPWTGSAADNFDQRKLMLITQSVMGLLAIGLGLMTLTGVIRLWEVYVFAFLLGTAAAFDAPARQTFVGELVGEEDLSNAVALNSTTFNGARMVGPAAAGLLIGVGRHRLGLPPQRLFLFRGRPLAHDAAPRRAASHRQGAAGGAATSPRVCATSGAGPT